MNAIFGVASLVAGIAIVVYALQTAIQTFLLPQPGLSLLSRFVFRSLQPLVHSIERAPLPPARRHAWLSLYAPLCLLLIVFGTIVVIGLGYTLILYGLGAPTLEAAFLISISSVSTLGFAPMGGVLIPLAATIETMIGVLIVALLIGYLPTIYAAVQERERAVAKLAMNVGAPPSGVAILARYAGPDGSSRFESLMNEWSGWFVALAESHNALAGIVFARSPEPRRSWVTTGGAVLDAAALCLTALDPPLAAGAESCLTAGSQALRQILDGVHLRPADHRGETSALHVTRAEFDAACAALADAGLPAADDRAAAWSAFAKRRGDYDAALVALCRLTRAPVAPWSSAHPAARRPLMLPLRHGRKHAAPTAASDA